MEFQKLSACDIQSNLQFHIQRRFIFDKCQKRWFEENLNILRARKIYSFLQFIFSKFTSRIVIVSKIHPKKVCELKFFFCCSFVVNIRKFLHGFAHFPSKY